MQTSMILDWPWQVLVNKYTLSKRQVVNELSTFYSFLLGFLIALIIGSVILIIQDKSPSDTFSLMFKLSIGSVNSFSSSLNKATPLILAGLGIAINKYCEALEYWCRRTNIYGCYCSKFNLH